MKKVTQGGHVGVFIGSLISVLIIGFLFVRFMSVPTQTTGVDDSLQPLTASGTVPVNKLDAYQADIDAANAIQDRATINTKKINQSLEIE